MYSRNLTYSILDGIFWSVMVGFGETYFIPYAVSLGASDLEIGLLASVPLVVGAAGQLGTPWLLKTFREKRKSLVRTGVILQAFTFAPILFVASWPGPRPSFLLGLVTLYTVFGLAISPAWQSWIGDLVPEEIRGRYFSSRNRWIHLATFASLVTAGLLLHASNFVVIFMIAIAARLISFHFLGRQDEPPYSSPPEAQFTLWEFVKKMRFNNYGLFVIFSSLMMFAASIAGPYVIAYQFKTLRFTYIEYMMSLATFIAVKTLFLPFWGHYSDRYGSRKLLSLSSYLLPIVPIVWLFADSLPWVIVAQSIAGFAWAGFELCSFNFILDCTTPEKRTRCAAYYQLFNGLGIVLGATVGGLLVKHPLLFSIPYFFTFFVSGLVRLYLTAVMMPKIRELREVESISYRTLLWRMLLLLKPSPG